MHMLGMGGAPGPPAFTCHARAGGVGACPLCGCGGAHERAPSALVSGCDDRPPRARAGRPAAL
eukprot:13779529-Alexandrium_andersonii.AAC.1